LHCYQGEDTGGILTVYFLEDITDIRIIRDIRLTEDLDRGAIWEDAEEAAGDFKLRMKGRKLR